MGGQRRWLWLSRRQRAFLVPFGGALVAGVMLGLLLAIWLVSGLVFESNHYKVLRDTVLAVGATLTLVFAFRQVKAAEKQSENQTKAIRAQTEQLRLNEIQMELTRRDQLSKRFTEAVKQLGDPKLEIRMGGIAGLWAVATESIHAEDRIMVLDVLCAFVRNASHPTKDEPQKIKPDVDFAMDRLGSVGPYFPWEHEKKEEGPYRRNFSGAYLREWKCMVKNYGHSDFNNSILIESSFVDINFNDTNFNESLFNSMKVEFKNQFITNFNFLSCECERANFHKSKYPVFNMCNISECNFFRCDDVIVFYSYYYENSTPNELSEEILKGLEVKARPTP